MSLCVPFLIAFLIGSLIFGAIYKTRPWKDPLSVIAAFWIGFMACSSMSLYSIFAADQYEPQQLAMITFIFTALCCLLCLYRRGSPFLSLQELGSGFWFKLLVVILIAWILTMGLSLHNFYGDWDAWSLWNYRARYLVSAHTHWKDIFTYNTQGKHPCLLPYWIVFGWTWIGGQSYAFTLFSAQVFTLLILATVFFSLLNLTKKTDAGFMAGMWLVSVPVFVGHSISQYADILTASLIVISIMLLWRMHEHRRKADAFVLGLMLGTLGFSKDEGIVSGLIILLLAFSLVKDKSLYLPLGIGLALFSIPTVLVKWWMFPAPSGPNSIYLPHLLEIHRWVDIMKYFCQMLLGPSFGGFLIIPLGLTVLAFLKPWDEKESLLGRFLTIFIALFLLLYLLVSGDLHWRLSATAYRLVYLVLPLATILLFKRLFSI